MVAPPSLHLFGCASTPTGRAYVYKLCGQGPSLGNYKLFLNVTNIDSSFITEFSLTDLNQAVRKAEGFMPSAEMMVGWLEQQCDCGTLDATVGADGRLQLSFEQMYSDEDGDMTITIRLPPGEAPLQVVGAASTTWVAQSVLFSMIEHMRVLKRKLQDCELRCTAAQEYEDTSAFMAKLNACVSGDGGRNGGGGGSEAEALVLPLAARVIPSKRKQPEEAEGPGVVVGSASKAARGSGQAAAAAAGAGVAAGVVAAGEQPASTQQTGGMSTQSRRTDLSEVGKPKRVAGRGRGRGRVPDASKTQVAWCG